MSPLVIIKTGSALPEVVEERGDFEHWITDRMGVDLEATLVVDVFRDHQPPAPGEVGAVVVTGSAAMVTNRARWSVLAGQWLADVIDRGKPVLGICYGHQLISDVLGGEVGKNPRGREIGTVEVRLTDEGTEDPLFSVLPSDSLVQSTHVESVLSLPPGARRLATSVLDPNQAFAIGERAWCVQFHPEADADVIREYIRLRRHAIEHDGIDPDAVIARTADSTHGSDLLRRFAELSELR